MAITLPEFEEFAKSKDQQINVWKNQANILVRHALDIGVAKQNKDGHITLLDKDGNPYINPTASQSGQQPTAAPAGKGRGRTKAPKKP